MWPSSLPDIQANLGSQISLVAWQSQTDAPNKGAFKAAGLGNMELIQWLYENGCPKEEYGGARGCMTTTECFNAALEGHIQVLEWLKLPGQMEVDRVYEMATLGRIWKL